MNKTAIVTGSSRGIGRAIAVRLARDGAQVVLCARNKDLLQEVEQQIRSEGGLARSISLDLCRQESQHRLVEFALSEFGRIDLVVNNAGATKRGDFLQLTDDDWTEGYALKFFGAVRLTRLAWPYLKAGRGSLVNIAGVGGRTPGPDFTIGGSVNAALLSFTKAMADVGVRDQVQVNAINPGMVRTDRFKARLATISEEQIVRDLRITGIGEPEDVAALLAFIVGPEGRRLHGALIDIDGGATKTL